MDLQNLISFTFSSDFLFYLFSFAIILSSFLVVFSKYSILSLLFLVSTFLFASFILFLLQFEFLALTFITIYAGAIAVLFLFVIMMLDFKVINVTKPRANHLIPSVFFSLLIFGVMMSEFYHVFNDKNIIGLEKYMQTSNPLVNWFHLVESTSDVDVYGRIIFAYFVIQFLIVGLILLLVLIGVVQLTNVYNQNQNQSTFKLVTRKNKIFYSN